MQLLLSKSYLVHFCLEIKYFDIRLNNLTFSSSVLYAKWAKPKNEDNFELTYKYDEKIITKELENEAGIIDKVLSFNCDFLH